MKVVIFTGDYDEKLQASINHWLSGLKGKVVSTQMTSVPMPPRHEEVGVEDRVVTTVAIWYDEK